MGPHIARALSIAGAAAVLTSCEEKGNRSSPHAAKTEEHIPYRTVDFNHYVITGDARAKEEGSYFSYPVEPFFPSNLRTFRDQVSGEFYLVPRTPNWGLRDGAYAIRKTITSSNGEPNTIHFVDVGDAED